MYVKVHVRVWLDFLSQGSLIRSVGVHGVRL